MQHRWNKIIATLLILAVVVSVLPFVTLHSHQEVACDEELNHFDLCHQQIYHGYFSAVNSCEHHTHIHEEINKCEWCKFNLPIRAKAIIESNTNIFCSLFLFEISPAIKQQYHTVSQNGWLGRAPPGV